VHLERHAVVFLGKLEDLGVGPGLLVTELVAGEGQDPQAARLVVFVKLLQLT